MIPENQVMKGLKTELTKMLKKLRKMKKEIINNQSKKEVNN